MEKLKNKIPEKLIGVFFLVLIFAYLSIIIFKNPNRLGIGDWDIEYAKAFCNIESIAKYRQFPLWNPYHCGGISQIGDPTNDYLNPLFVFNLIFGPNIGYRVIFLIYLAIGLISFYKLGRYLKLSFISSIFSSIVYVFSGLFFQVFAIGMREFLPLVFLPLALFYYFKALKTYSLAEIIKTAIIMLLIFFGGFHYLPLLIIFFGVLTLVQTFLKKNFRVIMVLIALLVIFFPLSSIKTVSVAEQTKKYPRFTYEDTSGYSLKSIAYSLFSRDQTRENFPKWGNFSKLSLIDGLSYNIGESGIYIGILPFIFLIIGITLKKNKYKLTMLTVLIIFLYLSFGLYINPSLYRLVHSLPIFDNLRVAQRYRYFFMIPLAFFSGLGLELFKSKKVVSWGLVFLIVLDLVVVNSKILKETFILPPVKLKKTANFVQSNGKTTDLAFYHSFEYPYLLAGYGVTEFCYEPRSIVPKNSFIESKDYQGEYYLKNRNGKVVNTYWSPNRLTFKINTKESNRLIVNQAFDKGWRVKSTDKKIKVEITNHKELIGINLPPGNYQISLYYLPITFIISAIITGLSVIVIMIFFTYSKKYE